MCENNSKIFSLVRCFVFGGVVLDLDTYIFPWQMCFILEVILSGDILHLGKYHCKKCNYY